MIQLKSLIAALSFGLAALGAQAQAWIVESLKK